MRPVRSAIAVLLFALVLLHLPRSVRAEESPPQKAEKLGALLLKSGEVDQDLADNLTEVLIARLAERRSHGGLSFAGKEQIRALMGRSEARALACIEDVACLGQVGVRLGITRIVVGTLGRRGDDYLYNLNLVDIATGKVENRIFQLVAGKVDALIAAVSGTADKLFAPKIEPGAVRVESAARGAMVYLDDVFIGSTPVRRDGIEPGPHGLRVEMEGHRGWANRVDVPAGSTLEISVPLASLPERRRWPGAFATTTFAGGAGVGLLGLVIGVLSQQQPPPGQTRVEALADVSHRLAMARGADALFAVGGALAITAFVTFLIYRHDILGTRTDGGRALTTANAPWRALAEGRF